VISSRRLHIPFFILAATAVLLSCGQNVALPDRYAIVYGVSDYGGAIGSDFNINNLSLPDDDAADMEALLLSQGYDVTTRTNSAATRVAFEADIAAVAAQAGPDDLVVIYFAGHGFGDGMEEQYSQELLDFFGDLGGTESDDSAPMDEYLFFHRTGGSADMAEFVTEQALTDDQIGSLIETIPAKRVVVFVDACHSGGFVDSSGSVETAPTDYQGSGEGQSVGDATRAFGLYLAGGGGETDIASDTALVLAASGEREFTWEDNTLGNGVFTYFLIEAVETGDRNRDGFVTVSELYLATRNSIADYWNTRYSGSAQFLPRTSGSAVDFALFSTR
jgi:uncharacterized caspase-like protein